MNEHYTNSRRYFLRKIGITGLAITGFPAMMNHAEASRTEKAEDTGNGMVFLFQGDSITDGNRGRNNDPNHIMGHGYVFSIASRLAADFPEKKLTFYNRGISGNKVSDLALRWQQDTIDLNPNVLSILIGVNDVGSRIRDGVQTVEQFEEIYKSILDKTKSQLPEILIVLCQPFILPVAGVKDNWEMWNTEMTKQQAIVEKLAINYNAVFVEFQQVMDIACRKAPAEYWVWDGVHPTVAGHELLAREWIRMVRKRIRFMK